MELLAGVLTQTDWMRTRGPSGPGNVYYRALKEFFSPYYDDPAVDLLIELTGRGFSFELPPAFICNLGPLPDLELKCEYSPELVRAAGGREALERLRLALRDLAAKSRFDVFIAAWQSRYDEWTEQAAGFAGDRAAAWLEGFFGARADEYHLILAPAMFPAGGYAAAVDLPSGGRALYAVIREPGRSISDPEIPPDNQLTSLALHEWGHSFVNPCLDSQRATIGKLRTLYWRTMRAMKRQGYGSLDVFLDEQVLRGVTCLAAEDFWGPEALAEEAGFHEMNGFYLTRPVIELLREYRAAREKYPSFQSFLPQLLLGLEPFRVRVSPWAIAGSLGVIGAIGWLEVRRLLREIADRRRRWLNRQPWIWK